MIQLIHSPPIQLLLLLKALITPSALPLPEPTYAVLTASSKALAKYATLESLSPAMEILEVSAM